MFRNRESLGQGFNYFAVLTYAIELVTIVVNEVWMYRWRRERKARLVEVDREWSRRKTALAAGAVRAGPAVAARP